MNYINKLTKAIELAVSLLSMFYVITKRNPKCGRKRILFNYSKLITNSISSILFNKNFNKVTLFGNKTYFLDINSLINSFQELFILDTYFIKLTKSKPHIIDCGSNIGLSVIYFKTLFPNSKITAIEPDPTTFKVLKKNIINNHLSNVTCINAALTDSSVKSIPFYINTSRPGALQMSTLHRWDNDEKIINVPTLNLSKFFKAYNHKIDLVKMDIEGMETKVISNLSSQNVLKHIDNLIIEYHHHIEPQTDNLSITLSRLEQNGFAYQITTNSVQLPFDKDYFEDIMIYAYQKTAI